MKMKYQTQELSLANGITLSFTASVKDNLVVYNAFGYPTGHPSEITHTFGFDLSPNELIQAILNTAGEDSLTRLLIPEFLEPFSGADLEDDDLTDGHFEQREARIMSLEAEFSGEEFNFSFPSSIELEEQPYFEPYDITDPDGF